MLSDFLLFIPAFLWVIIKGRLILGIKELFLFTSINCVLNNLKSNSHLQGYN